ncbi:hypothetical protein ABS735_18500 [Streptomyces sp. MMCC 100]|uniref:hypothetical protein n=1 Tax=Streptomyces sp. MMCC 100 TaxID=3163555 RepID=UPI0035961A94
MPVTAVLGLLGGTGVRRAARRRPRLGHRPPRLAPVGPHPLPYGVGQRVRGQPGQAQARDPPYRGERQFMGIGRFAEGEGAQRIGVLDHLRRPRRRRGRNSPTT